MALLPAILFLKVFLFLFAQCELSVPLKWGVVTSLAVEYVITWIKLSVKSRLRATILLLLNTLVMFSPTYHQVVCIQDPARGIAIVVNGIGYNCIYLINRRTLLADTFQSLGRWGDSQGWIPNDGLVKREMEAVFLLRLSLYKWALKRSASDGIRYINIIKCGIYHNQYQISNLFFNIQMVIGYSFIETEYC